MAAQQLRRNVLIPVLVILIISTAFPTLLPLNAQGGTPHPPIPTSPGNGTTITSSNTIQLCATASDNITSEIHFEVFQAPIPDFQTDWQSGNPVCATINVPNGHYTWHARGRNSAGEGGASPDWTFTVQVGNAPPPTRVPGPENPTAVPEPGPSFNWSFDPAANAQVGSTVTIHVAVNSSNPGATKISVGCGGVDKTETSEVSFDSHWNTTSCGDGNQTVTICSRSVSDQQWQRANCQSQAYPLVGNNNPGGPSAQFWADSYSIQTGQCTIIHWRTSGATSVNIDGGNVGISGDQQICPSVTTKYSLRASNGNSPQDATRNFTIQVSTGNIPPASSSAGGGGPQVGPAQNGQTPQNAKQNGISGGVDLIVYCYSKGFTNAGNDNNSANGWYCSGPQFWRVVWGQVCYDVYGPDYGAVNNDNSMDGWRCVQGGQQPNTGNTNPPQPNTTCGPKPSRLKAGDTALVSDFDPDPLEVYNERNVQSGLKFTVPIREKVSIIQGQSCAYNATWVEVGYQGNSGWAIEVNSYGSYNLIPDGMPLPGPGGKGNYSLPSPSSNCSGVLSPHLTIGQNTTVTSTGDDLVLHSGPGLSQPQIDVLSTNTSGVVVGGPICTDGYNWWQLQIKGKTGWAVEADSLSYWLQPVEQVSKPPTAWQQTQSTISSLQYLICNQSQRDFTPELFDSNPLSINKLNSKGFYLKDSECSAGNGKFAIGTLTWGGTSGSKHDEKPSQTVFVYAELTGIYVPDFDGELGMEVHLRLNGELFEAVTPLKAVLPGDIWDEIKSKGQDMFVGLFAGPEITALMDVLKELEKLTNIADSRAYTGGTVYLKVGNEKGQEIGADFFGLNKSADQEVNFPSSSIFRRWQYPDQEIVLHTIVPVKKGVPVQVHIGMSVFGYVYGTALMFWSPNDRYTTVGDIIYTKID